MMDMVIGTPTSNAHAATPRMAAIRTLDALGRPRTRPSRRTRPEIPSTRGYIMNGTRKIIESSPGCRTDSTAAPSPANTASHTSADTIAPRHHDGRARIRGTSRIG